MSCGCEDGNTYQSLCNTDTPYPQVSPESVPSLISNLVYALYGTIQKDVTSGTVQWIIPCDPNNTASIPVLPREEGEGLLCYILRIFAVTSSPTVSATRTTPFTLSFTDQNTIIPVLSASSIAITIPINDSVALGVGSQIMFQQKGAGQLVFTPSAGVVIQSSNSRLRTNTAFSVATLIKLDTNVWALTGDIV